MNTRLLSGTAHRPARAGLGAGILSALEIWRQRRALAKLDDHLLRDIGLTDSEAQREASRPIWDVPNHWLR